jgi:AcrR family transcriptional regulator
VPKVSAEYKAARIQELYRATWSVIARRGMQNISIEEILEVSGHSTGMVYGYFHGRDELVQAATEEALVQLRATLRAATEKLTSSPAELLSAVVTSFAATAIREPYALATASTMMYSRPVLGERSPEVKERYREFRKDIERHVLNWQQVGSVGRDASITSIAELMISILFGFFTQSPLLDSADVTGHMTALTALRSMSPPMRSE